MLSLLIFLKENVHIICSRSVFLDSLYIVSVCVCYI